MARHVVALGFGEAYGRCGVRGLTCPWGWPVGLKEGEAEGVVLSSFCIYLDCPGPSVFGPPAMALGHTQGYVTKKKNKKKICMAARYTLFFFYVHQLELKLALSQRRCPNGPGTLVA